MCRFQLPTASVFVCLMLIADVSLRAQTSIERAVASPKLPLLKSGSRTTDGTTGTGESTNKPLLDLTSAAQRIHGDIVIPTVIVKAERTQFSFVPPPGWRVQLASEKKQIRLVASESGSLILVEIIERHEPKLPSQEADFLRTQVLGRYPNSRITDEFSASALGTDGPAFDLEWRTPHNVSLAARFVRIPFEDGRLEISLSAPSSHIKHSFHDLNCLLLSFRSAPLNGSLELQPVTPE